ncbi:MAG TPA: MFS transporter [Gaiellaceae bacterium]|nr:MFS transporter [Gaiellaceae bacterium]
MLPVAALALRPQLVGIGPLIPSIQRELGGSHAVTGLLGTIPVLCMGVFAPTGAFLSRRVGSRRALAVALAAIGAFGVARLALANLAWLIALTFPVGVGMAVGNALLPVRVKESAVERPTFTTSLYASGITVGAAGATFSAVPLAHALGGWQAPLLLFSAVTLLLPAAWLGATRGERGHDRTRVPRPLSLPWRNGVAWHLVAIFVLMSAIYYGINTWLPDIYVERGWTQSRAGTLLAVFNVTQIPAALAVAALADRLGSRRAWLVGCAGLEVAALAGILAAPSAGFAWAVLLGCGAGPLFALAMALPLDVGWTPAEVAAQTGLMLGAGYTLTAVFPLALGVVRDVSHGFTAVVWALLGIAGAAVVVDALLTPARLRRGRSADSVAASG